MVRSTETRPRKRKLIIYDVVAALLVATGGIVFSVNHALSILSFLGGAVISAFSLRLRLINNGSKHRTANRWFAIIAIPSVFLCGWLLRQASIASAPKAHFKFWLTTTDFPQDHLELTNDFIMLPELTGKGPEAHRRPEGSVFVPLRDGQSNVTLVISVINDGDIVPQFGRVVVFVPKEWNCSSGPEWEDNESKMMKTVVTYTNGVIKTNQLQARTFRLPDGMLPTDAISLPPLVITPTWGTITIAANAKDSGYSSVAFDMNFLPPQHGLRLLKPTVIKTFLESNGTVGFSIPQEDFTTDK